MREKERGERERERRERGREREREEEWMFVGRECLRSYHASKHLFAKHRLLQTQIIHEIKD